MVPAGRIEGAISTITPDKPVFLPMPLHVEFMNAPRGSLSRAASAVKQADGGIFWWTIAIVVLMAMAAFSWIGSIYIFTHPEKPFNNQLLAKIHRLEPIKSFNEKDRPNGKNLTPPELYQKFYPFTDDILANHNGLLHRNFLTNYKSRDEKPYYVRGRFRVVQARTLTGGDVFPRGVVARAVAVNEDGKEFRNVVVEYVLTTAEAMPDAGFAPGDLLDIDSRPNKKRLYAAVFNISRLNEDVLVFTVVPLSYGEHLLDPAEHRVLNAVPPERLNMRGNLPVTSHSLANPARLPEVVSALGGQ